MKEEQEVESVVHFPGAVEDDGSDAESLCGYLTEADQRANRYLSQSVKISDDVKAPGRTEVKVSDHGLKGKFSNDELRLMGEITRDQPEGESHDITGNQEATRTGDQRAELLNRKVDNAWQEDATVTSISHVWGARHVGHLALEGQEPEPQTQKAAMLERVDSMQFPTDLQRPKATRTSVELSPEEVKEVKEDIENLMAAELAAAAARMEIKPPYWLEVMSAMSGWMSLSFKISKERQKRGSETYISPYPELFSTIASIKYEVVAACIQILNCIIIGLQLSLQSWDPQTEEAVKKVLEGGRRLEGAASASGEAPVSNAAAVAAVAASLAPLFNFSDHFFTALFLLDWALRVFAFGWVWVFELGNALETIIVYLVAVPLWILNPLGFYTTSTITLRSFTVLKLARLSTLAKQVRLKPNYKPAWVLFHGLVSSGQPMLWTFVVGLLIIYIGGVVSTQLIGSNPQFADDDLVQELFGNPLKSMYSMLQVMTLDHWVESIAKPVIEGNPGLMIFFVMYIAIAVFVFWNLVTAMIIDNAMGLAEQDQQNQAAEMEEDKKQELKQLARIFLELDEEGHGKLTIHEFLNAAKNKKVMQMLEVMAIDFSELQAVWNVLDDGDGELTVLEFANGMRRMKGTAKAKDIIDAVKRCRHCSAKLTELAKEVDEFCSILNDVETDATRMREDTSEVFMLFQEVYHRLDSHIEAMDKANKDREREKQKAEILAGLKEAASQKKLNLNDL